MSPLPNARKSHTPSKKKSSTTNAARSAPGLSQSSKAPHGNRRIGKKGHKTLNEPDVDQGHSHADEGLMTSAFPQYCDGCGKQMHSATAPYQLYCSEHCARPLPGSASLYKPFDGLSHDWRYSEPKRYVPEAKPTPIPPSPFARKPPYNHEDRRNLDPTEWKPEEVGRGLGPRKRITLNDPFDFSQGYTEHDSSSEEAAFESMPTYAASMPTRRASRVAGIAATPHPEIMRRVPSLSHASTMTASSSSSSGSHLLEEAGSFVLPIATGPQVSVAHVSVSKVDVLDEPNMKALSLDESRRHYSKRPVPPVKGLARGSLKGLLDGKV